MSDLQILHRILSGTPNTSEQNLDSLALPVWKTCLREIYFGDAQLQLDISTSLQDGLQVEIYQGVEAEAFLAEVLSGLKSQMVGETEVFGQFKNWWNQLSSEHPFKQRYKNRIDHLFNLVKQVREKALSGQGSQSYGSLIRKNLKFQHSVDVVGSGHLTEEILPWLQKQPQVRLWCRQPEKVCKRFNLKPSQISSMTSEGQLADVVIIAAPLSHDELNQWLLDHDFSTDKILFDLRADSKTFQPVVEPLQHKTLQDFFLEFAATKSEIQKKAEQARQIISDWKATQKAKAQVRPYGWDDL